MTRAEKLRGKIIDMAQGVSFAEIGAFLALLNDYADAAKEGEREKIRKAGMPVGNVTFSPDGKVMKLERDGREQISSYFIPASVLATTKESEK